MEGERLKSLFEHFSWLLYPDSHLLFSRMRLVSANSRTYIGSGKVVEIKSAIHALGVETMIFDDEQVMLFIWKPRIFCG
ncbi:hypothetical protein ABKV19_000254 [Rosa sericea]